MALGRLFLGPHTSINQKEHEKTWHLKEILFKNPKKHHVAFYLFGWVGFPSQNLPQHSPFELRTGTFQKPTAQKKPKNKPKTKTFQKPAPQWNTIKQGENHVAFYLFLVSWFSQPEPSTTQPVWVTNRNLPEAYSSRRTKKQTQNENLPEACTSVRYNKTRGKPCGVLTFFAALVVEAYSWRRGKKRGKTIWGPTFYLTSFSQPGPAGTTHLHPAAERRKRYTRMASIQQNNRSTLRRCNFFCCVTFPSPNLPQQSPLELRTRTFFPAKLKPSRSLHLNETL